MNGSLSPLFTKFQPIENANWQELQDYSYTTNGVHCFMCLKEKLIDSMIWVNKHIQIPEGRFCKITIYGDVPDLNQRIREASNQSVIWTGCSGENFEIHDFTFHVNDEKSEEFLECINLIDKHSPFGNPALFSISELVAVHSMEGVARINFLPLFVFFMAMKDGSAFPKELIIFICQSFIQSTGLEFAKNSSEHFRKDLIAKALQPKFKIENKTDSPSFTSNDFLTLQTSDID